MIKNIKIAFTLLLFMVGFNLSYGQTANSQDSANQNNSGTDISQQNGSSEKPNTSIDTSVHAGQLNGMNEGNFSIDKSGNIVPGGNTQPTEQVKGTRAPNEYPSGRSGGQFSNPNPAWLRHGSSKSTDGSSGTGSTGSESSGSAH